MAAKTTRKEALAREREEKKKQAKERKAQREQEKEWKQAMKVLQQIQAERK